jgi:PAS domain S-box-containing protein
VEVLAMKNRTAERLIPELEELRRKNAVHERLSAIFRAVPEERMYGEALTAILEITESRSGFLGTLAENGDLVIPVMVKDASSPAPEPGTEIVLPPAAWGESIWGRTLREGRSLSSTGPFQAPGGRRRVENALAVPIIKGKDVIGLIAVSNRERGYTGDEGRLLEDIAGIISPILSAHRQRDSHERMRRKTEEALRSTETQLSNALETARAGHWEYDVASDTFTFNDNFYRIFRTTAEKMGGYTMSSAEYARKLCHPDDVEMVGAEIAKSVRATDGDYSRQLEHRIVYDDGEIGHITVRFFIVKDRQGTTVTTYGVIQDITEYKRAEEIIQRSEEKFRSLFMSMSEGFYLSEVIYDEGGDPCDYRYLEVNPKFEQILGLPRDQIIGRRYTEIVPNDTTEWLKNYFRVALTGEPSTYEFYSAEYHMHFATYCYQPARGQVSVFVMNVTERKKLEDQLRQAQKMEAIGMLAGGIAHDFNNILTALMGYGSLLQSGMEADDPLLRYVEEMLSASQKAADLTRSLLAFSRQQPVVFRPLSINDIITGTENLLKRLVTEDVVIHTILSPDQPVIMADATQMDQVLFNLASNARDAMPRGGVLIIETRQLELDDEFRRLHGYGAPGKYVRLSISDNGMGMDEAAQKRIFDPFFTTKEVGKGTGMGLSTVYGIVKQHNGYITFYSEPGVGSTFYLYFPAVQKTVEKERTAAPPVRGGREVILIAEDNAAVRGLMREVLTRNGYTVLEAVDGADAVRKFSAAGNVDLLILDSIMPKKNGREAYNEIHDARPGIRVLFTSGYTRDIILDKGIEDGKFHFISKPVQTVDLLNTVREILDE